MTQNTLGQRLVRQPSKESLCEWEKTIEHSDPSTAAIDCVEVLCTTPACTGPQGERGKLTKHAKRHPDALIAHKTSPIRHFLRVFRLNFQVLWRHEIANRHRFRYILAKENNAAK